MVARLLALGDSLAATLRQPGALDDMQAGYG